MVSADAALASYAQLETPAYATLANLKLNGLPPETEFEVRLLNVSPRPAAAMKHIPALAKGEPIRATGQMLRTIGLPLPVLRAGEIAVFLLEPVPAQP